MTSGVVLLLSQASANGTARINRVASFFIGFLLK
jgi:hypothetical protein